MRDALRETHLFAGQPARHRLGGGGKGGAFAQAEQQAGDHQGDQPAGQAGEYGGARPYDAAQREHQPGTELVRRPAADDLEHEIGIGEGREHQPQLGIG